MYEENLLSYKNFSYLKWSTALIALCVALYLTDPPHIRQGGGTALGYALGTLGAIIILVLTSF